MWLRVGVWGGVVEARRVFAKPLEGLRCLLVCMSWSSSIHNPSSGVEGRLLVDMGGRAGVWWNSVGRGWA